MSIMNVWTLCDYFSPIDSCGTVVALSCFEKPQSINALFPPPAARRPTLILGDNLGTYGLLYVSKTRG